MVRKFDSDKVKQGHSGIRLLVMLVAALILAGVAWAVADLYFFQIAPGNEQFSGQKVQGPAQSETSPEQHLDNPSKAVPQQSKPLPKKPEDNGQSKPAQ